MCGVLWGGVGLVILVKSISTLQEYFYCFAVNITSWHQNCKITHLLIGLMFILNSNINVGFLNGKLCITH